MTDIEIISQLYGFDSLSDSEYSSRWRILVSV